MRENFLHYIWKFKKFNTLQLQTTEGEYIHLLSVGAHNHNSGPDFFNAKLKIGNQLWAGNVEIHVKSSDWFAHRHEEDKAYDNVILHVVYEHDVNVSRNDNSVIPTLELKHYINQNLIQKYYELFSNNSKWINCENDFALTDSFVLNHWLERLYIERIEQKSKIIEDQLLLSKNNWEAVLFKLLAKNFGLKVNADAFFSMANSIEFSIIQKTRQSKHALEALLFGLAGLLDVNINDEYHISLKNEYLFLKQKFQLSNDCIVPMQFFRLRPQSFPTLRLSQLAALYNHHQNLFSKIINSQSLNDFYSLFRVSASSYWETHYTFRKESKRSKKILSKSFVDLIIINTILPIKFSYARKNGVYVNDEFLDIIRTIKPEQNEIVNKFSTLKKLNKTALETQALVQLKNNYCNKHQCLKCAIGNSLLNK